MRNRLRNRWLLRERSLLRDRWLLIRSRRDS
jgi:hypothetical protein